MNLLKYFSLLFIIVILFNCSQNYAPQTPSAPSGPSTGELYSNCTFSSSTTDPDGDEVSYQFDWGDGNLSQWSNFIESGEIIVATHAWNDTGRYNIIVRATDTKDKISGWSTPHLIAITGIDTTNQPPNIPPTPLGVDTGQVDSTYTFYAVTTDPDGDNISYQFNWGDGNLSYWSDFAPSGNIVTSEHKWTERGTYYVNVHAKDETGEESAWSDRHKITVVTSPFPDRVVATIPVGNRPQDLAVLPNGKYIYVTNALSNDVSVISTSSNSVVKTIPVGTQPSGVTSLPNGEYVYVLVHVDNKVVVIRTSDNKIVDTISSIPQPHSAASLPSGEYLYVTSRATGGNVYVIRTSDNTLVDSITPGGSSADIVTLPNGEYVYVGNGEGFVPVIRTSNNTLVTNITIPAAGYPFYIAEVPNGEYVYVSISFSNQVYVIRTSDNTVIDQITVGNDPRGLVAHPSGNFVYVANRSDQTISVIRTSDNAVVGLIPAGSGALNIASHPNGEYIYVTNAYDNNVYVIGY
jgi:YVTN family beta-propeller protein